jgi:hypothetical protein
MKVLIQKFKSPRAIAMSLLLVASSAIGASQVNLPPGPGITPVITPIYPFKNVHMEHLPQSTSIRGERISGLTQFLGLHTEFFQPQLPASTSRQFSRVLLAARSGSEPTLLREWRTLIIGLSSISNSIDIESLAFIVLMEASKDADADLKTIMAETKTLNDSKKSIRETIANLNAIKLTCLPDCSRNSTVDSSIADANDKLDSLSELGDMEQLKLQLQLDKMEKMEQTMSNLLKKLHDTAESIIANHK